MSASMTDSARLLRAILERPDDDALRLVYADCLEDDGDALHAGFVRAQITLSPRPGWRMQDEYPELCRAEMAYVDGPLSQDGELGVFHGYSCAPGSSEIETALGGSMWFFTFRRGLVESVRCTLQDWLDHGPTLCARQPVTAVWLTNHRPWRCYYTDRPRVYVNNTENIQMAVDGSVYYPASWGRLLRGGTAVGVYDDRYYDTDDEAKAAVLAAAVDWARDKSALPPLPR